jgi:hypothetical protein
LSWRRRQRWRGQRSSRCVVVVVVVVAVAVVVVVVFVVVEGNSVGFAHASSAAATFAGRVSRCLRHCE